MTGEVGVVVVGGVGWSWGASWLLVGVVVVGGVLVGGVVSAASNDSTYVLEAVRQGATRM